MSQSRLDIQDIYERHVDTVYRVCYAFMGNAADTEDLVQDTFVKLMRADQSFEDTEHERAWLIRVASNACKDVLKSSARKTTVPYDPELELGQEPAAEGTDYDTTLDAVLRLDPKYKDVVYLHYYEGYPTDEIACILDRPASTVRNHLAEAREILRHTLGGDWT